jgi:hypothetical protein
MTSSSLRKEKTIETSGRGWAVGSADIAWGQFIGLSLTSLGSSAKRTLPLWQAEFLWQKKVEKELRPGRELWLYGCSQNRR